MSDFLDHHILALPAGITSETIELLARSRFTAARPDGDGIRLSRHSNISPLEVDTHHLRAAKVPSDLPVTWLARTPRERGEAPTPGLSDRTGISRACADGMPIRDEARVLQWLVAVARRLGGAVRVVPSGEVLRPDVESSVDLTVISHIWLDPGATLKVVSGALPRATFDDIPPWSGPVRFDGPVAGAEALDAEYRERLHERADAFDAQELAKQYVSEKYSVGADLEVDGRIDVFISLVEDMPPALRDVWEGHTAISYEVRWTPENFGVLELEKLPLHLRVARKRALGLVARAARAIHQAIGGDIVDDDRFVVDPRDLA